MKRNIFNVKHLWYLHNTFYSCYFNPPSPTVKIFSNKHQCSYNSKRIYNFLWSNDIQVHIFWQNKKRHTFFLFLELHFLAYMYISLLTSSPQMEWPVRAWHLVRACHCYLYTHMVIFTHSQTITIIVIFLIAEYSKWQFHKWKNLVHVPSMHDTNYY